jgi:hypothetical protein
MFHSSVCMGIVGYVGLIADYIIYLDYVDLPVISYNFKSYQARM